MQLGSKLPECNLRWHLRWVLLIAELGAVIRNVRSEAMYPHGVGVTSSGDPSDPKLQKHSLRAERVAASSNGGGQEPRWLQSASGACGLAALQGPWQEWHRHSGDSVMVPAGGQQAPAGPSTRHFDGDGHDLRSRRYRYRTGTPRSKPLHPPLAEPGGEPPCHDGLRFSPVPSSSRCSPSLPTHIVLTPPASYRHPSLSISCCLPTYLPDSHPHPSLLLHRLHLSFLPLLRLQSPAPSLLLPLSRRPLLHPLS